MKKKTFKYFALVLIFIGLTFLPRPLLANEPLFSSELVENFKKYDGREVVFKGEVVGEVIKRGDFAWLNINDDPYSVKSIPAGGKPTGYNSGQSIWIPFDEARKVRFAGSYNFQGDIVEVKGIFHAACPEHNGEMDIHASSLKVLKTGQKINHSISRGRILTLAFLALILFFLAALKLFLSPD